MSPLSRIKAGNMDSYVDSRSWDPGTWHCDICSICFIVAPALPITTPILSAATSIVSRIAPGVSGTADSPPSRFTNCCAGRAGKLVPPRSRERSSRGFFTERIPAPSYLAQSWLQCSMGRYPMTSVATRTTAFIVRNWASPNFAGCYIAQCTLGSSLFMDCNMYCSYLHNSLVQLQPSHWSKRSSRWIDHRGCDFRIL